MSKPRHPAESEPLIERVDALLGSHRRGKAAPAVHVPVLTDIVDLGVDAPPAQTESRAALEALARELERTVMDQLREELDRAVEERLAAALHLALERSLGHLRSELSASLREILRTAVAVAVDRALAARFPPTPSPATDKRLRKR